MRRLQRLGGRARQFLESTGKTVGRYALRTKYRLGKLFSKKKKKSKQEVCPVAKPEKKTHYDDIDTWGDEGGTTLSAKE